MVDPLSSPTSWTVNAGFEEAIYEGDWTVPAALRAAELHEVEIEGEQYVVKGIEQINGFQYGLLLLKRT